MSDYDLVCPTCASSEIRDLLRLTDEPGSPYDGFQFTLKCDSCKLEFELSEALELPLEPEEMERERLEAFAWSCRNES